MTFATATVYTDEESSLITQKSSLEGEKARLEVLAKDDLESGRQLEGIVSQIKVLDNRITVLREKRQKYASNSLKQLYCLFGSIVVLIIVMFATGVF